MLIVSGHRCNGGYVNIILDCSHQVYRITALCILLLVLMKNHRQYSQNLSPTDNTYYSEEKARDSSQIYTKPELIYTTLLRWQCRGASVAGAARCNVEGLQARSFTAVAHLYATVKWFVRIKWFWIRETNWAERALINTTILNSKKRQGGQKMRWRNKIVTFTGVGRSILTSEKDGKDWERP